MDLRSPTHPMLPSIPATAQSTSTAELSDSQTPPSHLDAPALFAGPRASDSATGDGVMGSGTPDQPPPQSLSSSQVHDQLLLQMQQTLKGHRSRHRREARKHAHHKAVTAAAAASAGLHIDSAGETLSGLDARFLERGKEE